MFINPKYEQITFVIKLCKENNRNFGTNLTHFKQFRSRSMPFINKVDPHQYPQIQKLRLVPTDSMASNGSFFGYGSKIDSGIADENASGMSVGVIPDALVDIVQANTIKP